MRLHWYCGYYDAHLESDEQRCAVSYCLRPVSWTVYLTLDILWINIITDRVTNTNLLQNLLSLMLTSCIHTSLLNYINW